MADFDEASNDEKLEIAQYFLLNSPPGQFHEVLTDVRKLLPEGLLTDQCAAGIARAYNSKTGKIVTAPSGLKTILSPAGELDPTHYIDPSNQSVFSVDHLTMETMSSEKVLSDMPHESLSDIQKELQDLLKSHLSESYPSEESAGSIFCKNGNINITITGEKSNLRNFWSGRISSTWILTPAPPPSALTGLESSGDVSDDNDVLQFCISGDIKTHAHYYEDGNVQLQSSRSFPSKQLNLNKELNTVAKDAMMHIKESENSLQAGLQDMYLHMNEETFRQMRRLMPVTRSKMEWNINAVRMIKQTRK
mmetsp:Transcript_11230/g.10851  ORF Transcript_11230/g.10851 Transcript_11230/m.10851 type:complete len:306 (+) Transcript_11230:134-1051(+)|eukprot:CAMPEP_0119034370 /NCGR_PEP_ID=MMETSP1177-20130426/1354_1 /TAXON_ID=2985 /ORGANISM="Ochromonas sp, Strain CCMP1899" /LENGTH=305 /DNA_ID=CAMNT_0006991753 /DNA_START=31 /DNA_END=948 /DNA_ORIENTATION=-